VLEKIVNSSEHKDAEVELVVETIIGLLSESWGS